MDIRTLAGVVASVVAPTVLVLALVAALLIIIVEASNALITTVAGTAFGAVFVAWLGAVSWRSIQKAGRAAILRVIAFGSRLPVVRRTLTVLAYVLLVSLAGALLVYGVLRISTTGAILAAAALGLAALALVCQLIWFSRVRSAWRRLNPDIGGPPPE